MDSECDVFISCRRDGSIMGVSSLYSELISCKNFTVFADTASMKPGDSWAGRIQSSLQNAQIVLAVIGNNWLCKDSANPHLLRLCVEGIG